MRRRATTERGPEMVGRPTLRGRGWTLALMERFLGEPDATAPNPHYKCAPPRKLFLVSRVEHVEKSRAFRTAKQQAEARKTAAAKANATKLAKLVRYIDELRVEVEVMTQAELLERACAHYNFRQACRAREVDDWRSSPAGPGSSQGFLDRISVNYLRHRCTRYEEELLKLHGRTGAERGAAAVKRKVLEAIGAAYPHLAAECERQSSTAAGL